MAVMGNSPSLVTWLVEKRACLLLVPCKTGKIPWEVAVEHPQLAGFYSTVSKPIISALEERDILEKVGLEVLESPHGMTLAGRFFELLGKYGPIGKSVRYELLKSVSLRNRRAVALAGKKRAREE
jgi:hypothetical protein